MPIPSMAQAYISKQDISDSFCRVPLDGNGPGGAVSHGVLGFAQGVGNSPPIFCAITKTVAHVANDHMALSYAPPHQLERIALTPIKPPWACPLPLS